MCGSDHPVPQVNSAKCWAIPALIFGIISCIGLALSAITGPLIAGLGGIVGTIGASILICCGPAAGQPGGDGKMMAGAVLMGIAAGVEIIGAIVGIALFFSWEANIRTICSGGSGGTLNQPCYDLSVGFTAILMWPSVAISIIAGIIFIVAAVKSAQARSALLAGGSKASV